MRVPVASTRFFKEVRRSIKFAELTGFSGFEGIQRWSSRKGKVDQCSSGSLTGVCHVMLRALLIFFLFMRSLPLVGVIASSRRTRFISFF